MADKKQRRNNKNYDEDYNPKFRNKERSLCFMYVTKILN